MPKPNSSYFSKDMQATYLQQDMEESLSFITSKRFVQ